MSKETIDVIQPGARYRILRLHDGEVIRYSGFKLLAVEIKRLFVDLKVLLGDLDLGCGRLQIEISIADVTFYSTAYIG